MSQRLSSEPSPTNASPKNADAGIDAALILVLAAIVGFLLIRTSRRRKPDEQTPGQDESGDAARLEALAELRAAGLITEQEFQAKCAEIRRGI